MTANLRTLDRLQVELQTINDALKSAEDRKILYQTQMVDLEKHLVGLNAGSPIDANAATLVSRIEQLKEELAKLQVLYKENYPDIALLKKQIRELEEQMSRGEIVCYEAGPRGGDSRRGMFNNRAMEPLSCSPTPAKR